MFSTNDWFRVPMAASLAVWLTACSTGYAPVADRTRPAATQAPTTTASRTVLPNPGSYRVVRGDTLYSIAWRYGLDYRQVAAWNGIDGRYQIFPGQTLTLRAPGQGTAVAAAPPPPPPPASRAPSTPAPATGSTVESPPPASRPAQPAATPAQAPAASAPAPAPRPATPAGSGPVAWQWPASGSVISGFSARADGNKGIDISGNQGDPVYAASDGRVVYAGSGLLGYGNLVILNHNHQFLSAYAHNSRILVNENDMVKGGQKIAEMGSTGTDRVKLHFEIRQDGKPVDPVRFLPKR